MAIKQVGPGHWYSTLAEQTYDSELAARHYDNEERMKLSVDPEEKFLESLSTDQVKMYAQQKQVWAEKVHGSIGWKNIQQDFVNANPDYLPNEANGRTLAATLVALGKLDPVADVFLGTLDDMQNAYIELAEKGMLQLRAGTPIPKRAFNEAEAYELDLAELEKRGRGW